DTGAWRPAILGLPAFALVGGALTLERAGAWPRLHFAERVGDWSYSLYLLQGLALKAVAAPLAAHPWLGVPLGILAGGALAYLSYRFFERPMAHFLRQLLPVWQTPLHGGVAEDGIRRREIRA